MSAFSIMLERDLRLAFRRWSALAYPLIFYVIVAGLFPLALTPQGQVLQTLGIGVVWISAFLAALLGIDGLFSSDAEDGSLEQIVLSPAPLSLLMLAKLCAHWIVSCLPLLVLVPIMALSFDIPASVLPTLVLALLLATPTLSVFVALGAAVTVSLKASGSIIGLLVLPLCAPLLIFGAQATERALYNGPTAAPLYMLAAIAVLAVALGPVAVAAGVRVSVE